MWVVDSDIDGGTSTEVVLLPNGTTALITVIILQKLPDFLLPMLWNPNPSVG